MECDAFVVTGKDEVKLDAAMRLRLNDDCATAHGRAGGPRWKMRTLSLTSSGPAADMRKSPLVTAK